MGGVACARSGVSGETRSSGDALKGCICLSGVVIFKNEQVSPRDNCYVKLHTEIVSVIIVSALSPLTVTVISTDHWHLRVRSKAFVNLLNTFGSMIPGVRL